MSKKKLTERQKAFVAEYMVDLQKRQAAIRAGYSAVSAHTQANKLFNMPHVKAEIDRRMVRRAENVKVRGEDVLREIKRLALGDVRGLYDDDGNILPVHEWSDEVAARVSSVDTAQNGDGQTVVTRVRLWDKSKNLDMLMRHLGAYAAEKVEHDVSDRAAEIWAARRRAGEAEENK